MIKTLENYEFAYDQFMIEEALQDKNLSYELSSLIEDVTLLEDYQIIQESAVSSFVEFVTKIFKSISEAINKFIDRVKEKTGIDQKWLNDNKARILGKIVDEDAEIKNFYNYDLEKLRNIDVPDLDENELERNPDKYQTKEDFITNDSTILSRVYGGVRVKNKSDESTADSIKHMVRGNNVDIKGKDLDMDKYYKYCAETFPNIKIELKSDIDKIKGATNKINIYLKSSNADAQANINSTTNEAMSYEDTLSYYFNEADDDESMKIVNSDKDEEDKTNNTSITGDGEDKKKSATGDKAIQNAFKSYYKVCSEILSTKMNLSYEIYNTYMKILRWQVDGVKKQTSSKNQDKKEQEAKAPIKSGDQIDVNGITIEG